MEKTPENPVLAQGKHTPNQQPRDLGGSGPDTVQTGPITIIEPDALKRGKKCFDFDTKDVITQDEEEEEMMEELDDGKQHKFVVGDFVWCKLKNRPWWPGQIYHPSDASKDVARFHRRDRILVVLFGNGIPALWCYPFQIKPFQDYFRRMTKQGSLTGDDCTGFYSAVEEACDGIRRRVQLEMMCNCIPAETRTRLARPLSLNSGIREGVFVPESVINGFSVPEYDPAQFLSHLTGIAQAMSEPSVYDLTIFQSQLLAFYCVRGDKRLPIGVEPVHHEENYRNAKKKKGKCSVHTKELLITPQEDRSALPVSPKVVESSSQKRQGLSEIKSHQRKKQRNPLDSAAKKERKSMDYKCAVDADLAENGSRSSTLASSAKEQKERNPSEYAYATIGEQKHVSRTDDTIDANEGSKTGTYSRERKKSKYLSPPYTTLGKDSKMLNSVINSETEPPQNNNARPSDGTSKQEPPSKGSLLKRKGRIGLKLANTSTEELLTEFHASALDAFYLKEAEKYGVIKRFYTSLRSYRYTDHQNMFSGVSSEADSQKTFVNSTSGSKEKMHYIHKTISNGLREREERKLKKEATLVSSECKDTNAGGGKVSSNVQGNGETPAKVPFEDAPGVNMHMTNHRRPENVVEGKTTKRKRKDKFAYPKTNGPTADGMTTQNVEGNRVPAPAPARTGSNVALGETMHRANHLISSENVMERKKRKTKTEDKLSHPKSNGLASDGMATPNVKANRQTTHESNHPMADRVAEGTGKLSLEASAGISTAINLPLSECVAEANGSHNLEATTGISPATSHPMSDDVAEGNGSYKVQASTGISPATGQPMSDDVAERNGSYNIQASTETSPATLLLKFAPGAPLPTKDALVRIFETFGVLNERDTKIVKDSACAQVVYIRSSDAEDAFCGLQENNPFGHSTESYLIQPSSATCMGSSSYQCLSIPSRCKRQATDSKKSKQKMKSSEYQPIPLTSMRGDNLQVAGETRLHILPVPLLKVGDTSKQLSVTPLLLGEAPLKQVRENLEKMNSMLERSGDDISPEVKAKLEVEITRLHKKVTALVESPPPPNL